MGLKTKEAVIQVNVTDAMSATEQAAAPAGKPATAAHFSFALFPSTFAHSVAILAMCEALESIGFRTTLFAARNPERAEVNEETVFSEYGIRVRPTIHWVGFSGRKWGERVRTFFTALRWAGRFDVCVARNPLAAFACHLRRSTCYYEMHSPSFGRLDRALVKAMRRSRSVRFVAISGVIAQDVSDDMGIDRARIVVAHSGCKIKSPESGPPLDLGPLLASYFASPALHAVYVGSFYDGRGVDMITKLARRHPDVAFLAVGATDNSPAIAPEDDGLPNFRVSRSIPHGLVEAVLSRADILLMPYAKKVTVDGEGDRLRYCSPLKMFEYLAAGKPIVSSGSPSIEEVLKDGQNALIAEAENVGAWSAAIDRLKRNPELRASLSKNAFETALRYTWEVRTRNMLSGASTEQGFT